MPTTADLFLGSLAVTKGFTKSELVNECLRIQAAEEAADRPRRMLGQILVEKGYLSTEQVAGLVVEQERQTQGRTLGPYELVGKLGAGGMGTVYKARDTRSGEVVALKVLPEKFASDATLVSRFQREARLGMEMRHPNIVRTLDHGEAQGAQYLALELVEGGDLDQRAKAEGKLPEREALTIVREVVRALSYAHDRGLVHRDIKPANIMFDKSGKVKLSDFGLVKSSDPDAADLTQVGEVMGTPHYLSPEQARGEKDLDFRSDIYSLGATLYYLTTGRKPFEGNSPYEVIAKHVSQPLRSPAEVNPALSRGCVALTVKMMAKDRERRYRSFEELAVDLDRLLRGEAPLRAALPAVPRVSVASPAAVLSEPAGGERKPPPVQLGALEERKHANTKRLIAGAVIAAFLLGALLLYLGSRDNRSGPVEAQRAPEKTREVPAAPGKVPAKTESLPVKTTPPAQPEPLPLKTEPPPAQPEIKPAPAKPVFLADLPELEVRTLDKQHQHFEKWSFGKGRFGRNGIPIQVQGQPSPRGLAMNVPGVDRSTARVSYALGKRFGAFQTVAALNDTASFNGTGRSASPLTFRVLLDGDVKWTSKELQAAGSSETCEVEVAGIEKLELQVECAGSHWFGQGVWLEPRLTPAQAEKGR